MTTKFPGLRQRKLPKEPEKPSIVGTDLELMVYDWLVKHGLKENIDFTFQTQLIGGYGRQLGDAIADFVILEPRIVFRIMGEYWHGGTRANARDQVQRERLENMGYKVVDLWESSLRERLDDTMRAAMVGEEL